MSALAVALALVAAALFAVAAAAQQRSAAAVPDDRGPRLVLTLVRRPLWWVGTLADVGGYVAQAAALGLGSLLLVQPLLVTSLLFALPLGARWAGRRPGRAELVWSALLVAALAAFVVSGEPTAGVDHAGLREWAPAAFVLGPVLGGCLIGAAARRGTARAALTKGVVGRLDDGVLALLASWETYGLAVTLVGGTLLQQSAFQAGDLGASLPAVMVGEPVVAVGVGLGVLHERLRVDGGQWLLIGGLVAVMVTATVALARSAARVRRVGVG